MARGDEQFGIQIEVETGQSEKAIEGLTKDTKKLERGLSAYDKTADKTKRSSQKMGYYAQQAGYQVGDFAVQVQGGTSALVAFTQQGSQLLSMFGPSGAVAGAGLAVGTILYSAFSDAADATKTFADAQSDLSDALGDNSSLIVQTTDDLEGLEEKYGKLTDSTIKYLGSESKARIKELVKDFDATFKALTEEIDDYTISFSNFLTVVVSGHDEMLKGLGLTSKQFYEINSLLKGWDNVKGFEHQAAALENLYSYLETVPKTGNKNFAEFRNAVTSANLAVLALRKEIGDLQTNVDRANMTPAEFLETLTDPDAESNLGKYTGEVENMLHPLKVLETRLLDLHAAFAKGDIDQGDWAYSAQKAVDIADRHLGVTKGINLEKREAAKQNDLEAEREQDRIKELEKSYKRLASPQRKAKEARDELFDAFTRDELPITLEDYRYGLTQVKIALKRATDQAEKFNDELSDSQKLLVDGFEDAGKAIGSAFADGISDGKSFDNVLKDIGESLKRIVMQQLIVKPMESMFAEWGKSIALSMATSGTTSGTSGSSGTTPGNAIGGTVYGNRTHLVGERGPELFTPKVSGDITPNNKLGDQGGNTYVTMNVTTPDANSFRRSERQLIKQVSRTVAGA